MVPTNLRNYDQPMTALRFLATSGTFSPLLIFASILVISSTALAIDIGTGHAYREQKFESWGTSLVWFGNATGNWADEEAHTEVMDLLFDGPNHLGLNYARYNIAGGQNRLLVGNFRQGAVIQGWVPKAPTSITDTSTWEWDWDADASQRKSLDAAIARSANRVDAIAYSPPYWMTNNLDASGADDGGLNLQTSLFDEYAYYHAEVLKHFRDELGVRFGNLSPMNEPNGTWWDAGGELEGMHVSQGFQQRQLIQTMGQTLAAHGLNMGITAAEESAVIETVNSFGQYDASTLNYVTQINTHGYGGLGNNTLSSMQTLRNIAEAEGLSLYQSEYGNNSQVGNEGAITLANRITADVNLLGVNGWTYWQAIEPVIYSGAGWGLLWADYNINGSLTEIRPQYHAMRQFTSYIRPGATILNTSDDETVAAYNKGSDTTALVFTNDEASVDTNVYNLLDQTPEFTRLIRTDALGNYVSLGPANVEGNQLTVNSPGEAISTVVVHHQPNLIQNATFAGSTGWQITGNASYSAGVDNTQDGSGGAVLETGAPGNIGAVWQDGIGDAATDLTGKAYEFSVDLMLANNPQLGEIYGASMQVVLEFYGADGETLTHVSTSDFSEDAKSISADSEYRVFRTDVVQAPAGTRFVRPVVRFDNVESGATGVTYIDNAYLQETRYVPRARAWKADANGNWNDVSRWQDDSLVANNSSAYFGPHISSARTIAVDIPTEVIGLTFDSSYGYLLVGDGSLRLGGGAATGRVDVRSGAHKIDVPTTLSGTMEFQFVDDAQLAVDGLFNLDGQRLEKTGPGQLTLAGGMHMGGGTLSVPANLQSSVKIGAGSTLDGTIQLELAPGQDAPWGSLYTLADFASPELLSANVELPVLTKEWLAWEVQMLTSGQLTAQVVNLADINRDSTVDQSDLSFWQASYGQNAEADINGDGLSNGADLLLWQRAATETFETNTLALIVDPTTGNARIENLSPNDFTFDAYTVSSESGSLSIAWDSLEDQGVTGWTEVLPSTGRISELNPTSEALLVSGASLDLDGLFELADGLHDLQFQFRDAVLGTVNGIVFYDSIANSVPGGTPVPEPTTFWIVLPSIVFLGQRSFRPRS